MKHAFLVIAHNNWDYLKQVIETLDSDLCDFYIHVNTKVSFPSNIDFSESVRKSKVYFTPRIPIIWGEYGICEASIIALKEAYQNGGGYDYYHLLTGSDIPLYSMRKLDSFFEANVFNNPSGKMKTNYLSAGKPNAKMASRVKYYNSFIGHWRDSNKCTRKIATASNTLLCYIQRFMGIDRFKRAGVELYCGSSWWSITHDFAEYYLSKSEWAEKQFGRATFAADEFVPHTVLMNSKFRDSCYDPPNGIHKNLRLLDFDGGNGYGSPKVWTMDDKEILVSSKDLFARKFEKNIDNEIIEFILDKIKEDR